MAKVEIRAFGALIVVLLASAPAAFALPACMLLPDDAAGFPRIFQQMPPPVRRDANPEAWPGTDFATSRAQTLGESGSDVGEYFFLWANRCHAEFGPASGCRPNLKGNFPQVRAEGRKHRFYFRSFEHANNCTLLQARRLLGAAPDELVRDGAGHGLVVVEDTHAAVRRRTADEQIADTCLLPPRSLPAQAKGIVLDYEPHDGRTPESAELFLRQLIELVKSAKRQLVLYTNPLTGPGVRRSGLTEKTIASVADGLEFITVLPTHRTGRGSAVESLNRQIDMLAGVSASKIMLTYDLNSFSVNETRDLRKAALDHGIRTVMIWRHGNKIDGECGSSATVKMTCLVFGRCTPVDGKP